MTAAGQDAVNTGWRTRHAVPDGHHVLAAAEPLLVFVVQTHLPLVAKRRGACLHEVSRTAAQAGVANRARRALLLVNQHARRGEAIGAALAVLAAGGVTVEEHDYPKRGCVGVSAAVYANRGFELCAAALPHFWCSSRQGD